MSLGLAAGVGVTQAIGAAAVLLLVELLFAVDLLHAVAAAVLAPVVAPVGEVELFGGHLTGTGDLVEVLPTRKAEAGGDSVVALILCYLGGNDEAVEKAHAAADAFFWFEFHATGEAEPAGSVVVAILEGDAFLLAEGDVVGLAEFVLLTGVDVGVVKQHLEIDFRLSDGTNNLSCTGCTATVEEDTFGAGRGSELGHWHGV